MSTPLLGPRSPLAFQIDAAGLYAAGDWRGLHVAVSLVPAPSAPAWFWHVGVENRGAGEAAVDLLYAQDVALAPYGAIRMNDRLTPDEESLTTTVWMDGVFNSLLTQGRVVRQSDQ